MHASRSVPQILIAAGALLFLLGLITGFTVNSFINPRMGLASHLEGVMNGTFLMVVGLAWSYVRLGPGAAIACYGMLLYGSFANWGFVTLAAAFGTSRMTPIAGAGFAGSEWQEQLVSAGLLSVGLAMVAGVGLLVWGLLRAPGVTAETV